MKGKGALTAATILALAGLAGLVIAADPLATSNSTTIGSQDSSISKAFELLQPLINTAPECSKKCLADIKGLDNVGSLTVESNMPLNTTSTTDSTASPSKTAGAVFNSVSYVSFSIAFLSSLILF